MEGAKWNMPVGSRPKFKPMPKKTPSHLRIHREPAGETLPAAGSSDWISLVCSRFGAATGWSLRFVADASFTAEADSLWSAPIDPGVGAAPGYLTIDPTDTTAKQAGHRSDWEAARELAAYFAEMVNEIGETRRALWHREAEIAAGVPVVPRPDEDLHLAERLQAVLKGGAEAIGCEAAALYLLDSATTELKLRASFGLPATRLMDAPRPLRGAVADLEALTGHAVVLEESVLHEHWKVPEAFPAAICVPVATPSTILGTLWVFSTCERKFDDRETNQIEIIAGRLAADLEREMLLSESATTDGFRRRLEEAERLQENWLPSVKPPHEDWNISGWIRRADGLSGHFYDWSVLPDGRLALAVGNALQGGPAAALVASAVRAALWAHADYHGSPADVLQRANQTLWSTSAGDQFASLALATIDPDSGRCELSVAGRIGVLHHAPQRSDWIGRESAPLAVEAEAEYAHFECRVSRRGSLILCTEGSMRASDARRRSSDRRRIERVVDEARGSTAPDIATAVGDCFVECQTGDDAAVLVALRR